MTEGLGVRCCWGDQARTATAGHRVRLIRSSSKWSDADRITREEIDSGAACKACGRSFIERAFRRPQSDRRASGPRSREATESRRLHPDCHDGHWTFGEGGIAHCSKCAYGRRSLPALGRGSQRSPRQTTTDSMPVWPGARSNS